MKKSICIYLVLYPVLFSLLCCVKTESDKQTDLYGTWILKDYMTALENEKSPYKAYDALSGNSCLFIESKFLDSSRIGTTFFNNQGGELVLSSGSDKNTFEIIDDAEGYARKSSLKIAISKDDTLLTILYNDPKRPRKDLVFKHVSKKIIYHPLDYYSNSLFVGKYDIYDSTKANILFSGVALSQNMTVSNFGPFLNFNVLSDYAFKRYDFDVIGFSGSQERENDAFAYKFERGNILMNRITYDNDEPKVSSLKYFLKRLRD